MGFRLFLYLGILAFGGFIGFKMEFSEKLYSKLHIFQNISLLFLLFIMGIKIGIDENIISSFFTLGFKAIIMSIFTILFSILSVFIVRKLLFTKEDNIEL